MSFFSETITTQVKIPPSHLDEIESKFNQINVSRKSIVVQSGEIANKLALIESGYLRMYHIDISGKETTTWIGGSGKFITSISSFIERKASYWTIEAITDSKLHVIGIDSHSKLCHKFRKWLDFENLLLAKMLSAIEYRTFELMSMKSEERFRVFFQKNSNLFLHVPAKYIASMLGFSEETLSRLKKNTPLIS
ncbi:MAG: Crp/Fnr family transcriptional regulator [Bacteroidota bacterium]